MGCMLHWAEGNKTKNTVHFTNSDLHMLRLFLHFLREDFQVKNNDIHILINCFLTQEEDFQKNLEYWTNELNISGCKFTKPTIKITNKEIKNFGICRISVYNTQIAQHIFGAIQEYGNFSNDFCLNKKSLVDQKGVEP